MEILKKTAAFRVAKQTEGKAPDEVACISLSGVPVLPQLWAPYTHLTHLLLVCMKPKLTALEHAGLEHLSSLRLLDISDNAVSVLSTPPQLPSLARLLTPNNRISAMAEIERIAESYPNLEVLDVADNAVDTPAHFSDIFAKFPKLVALNSKTRDGAEVVVEDSDESESEEEETDEEESDEEELEEESSSDREPEAKKQRREDGEANGDSA